MREVTPLDKARFPEARVPSVDRALDLLELLARSGRSLRFSDLSRKLRIPKSSLHYLIQNLASRGYLEREPNGRGYLLGLCVTNFANAEIVKSQLNMVCSRYLEKLTTKLGLTAAVGVLDGTEGLVIDVKAPTDIRYESWAGRHFDLHCSALGKALIAHLSDMEIDKLFQGRALPKHNPNTVCSVEVLKGHLAEARTRGFATNNEELDVGIRCVGAPILNSAGRVIAAVSVGSSVRKVGSSQILNLGDEIAAVSKEISRQLRDWIPPDGNGEILLPSGTDNRRG